MYLRYIFQCRRLSSHIIILFVRLVRISYKYFADNNKLQHSSLQILPAYLSRYQIQLSSCPRNTIFPSNSLLEVNKISPSLNQGCG